MDFQLMASRKDLDVWHGQTAALGGMPVWMCKGAGVVAGRAVVAIIALAFAGCGYSHQPLYPDGIGNIAIPIFENRTEYRDLEFDITEALIKEIELQTPYKAVRTGDADSVLRGSITDVQQRLQSRSNVGGLPQEIEVTVMMNLEWKNARTGATIRDRRGFPVVARYVPARSASEPFAVARHEVAQQTAREIVALMRRDW